MNSDTERLYEAVEDIFAPEKRKQQVIERDKLERLVYAAKTVIATEEGRRFVWWILSRGNLFASTYTGRALDQAHLDGARMIAAEVLSLVLKADPMILHTMVEDKLLNPEEESDGS